jgi:deoxyribose-phosphate aldolase
MRDYSDDEITLEPGAEGSRRAVALRLLAMLDLTRLEDDADDSEVRALVRRADTAFGTPAAVCVYPHFVSAAAEELAGQGLTGRVAVATVANFPDGSAEPERAAAETRRAISLGADEVDVVLPWEALRDGDDAVGARLVEQCRAASTGKLLKVILETGMLADAEQIRRACAAAIDGGADFVKTSTGKAEHGATPEAAEAMLDAIAERGGRCGIKVSGGVRTLEDARVYLDLADDRLGAAVGPDRFRIGASSLLDDLLAALEPVENPNR